MRTTIRSSSLGLMLALSLAGCGDEGAARDGDGAPGKGDDVNGAADEARAEQLYQLLVVEDHRLLDDPLIKDSLASDDARVVHRAALAAGRIQDRARIPDLIALLDHPHPAVRRDVGFALGLMIVSGHGEQAGQGEDQVVVAALTGRLAEESDPMAIKGLAFAAGRVCDATCYDLLASLIGPDRPVEVQEAGAEALSALLKQLAHVIEHEGTGEVPPLPAAVVARLTELLGQAPVSLATAAAQALMLQPGEGAQLDEAAIGAALDGATDVTHESRLLGLLARVATPTALERVLLAARGDAEPVVRAIAVSALGGVAADAAVLDTLMGALSDEVGQVTVAALGSLAAQGEAAAGRAAELVSFLAASASPWIKAEGLNAAVALDVERGRALVEAALAADDWRLRYAAVDQLQKLATDADVVRLDALLADPDPRVQAEVISALSTLDAARLPAGTREKIVALAAAQDPTVLLFAGWMAPALGWTELAPILAAAYDAFPHPSQDLNRSAIIEALGALGAVDQLPLIERALDDDVVSVVAAAVAAIQTLTGADVSDRLRAQNRVREETPSQERIAAALGRTVVFDTTRGEIRFALRSDQPLAAEAFVRRVETGFYDGIDFHRVVPRFVAQGGDPRGEGFATDDDTERDAFTMGRHTRGSLGIASSGRDTGSSQFFINHLWNQNLDAEYAVFADVSEGLEVVDRLEVGDVIESATVE